MGRLTRPWSPAGSLLIHLLPVHLDPGATGVTLDFATAEKLWEFLNAAETVTRGLRQLRAFGWFKEDDDG